MFLSGQARDSPHMRDEQIVPPDLPQGTEQLCSDSLVTGLYHGI